MSNCAAKRDRLTMSDDSSEDKTEEGSEKKTRDALESGNTPFSREASVFMSLSVMLIVSSFVLAKNVPGAHRHPDPGFRQSRARSLRDTGRCDGGVCRDGAGRCRLPVAHSGAHDRRRADGRYRPGSAALRAGSHQAEMVESGHRKPDSNDFSGGTVRSNFLKNLAKFIIVSGVVAIVMHGQAEPMLETLYKEPEDDRRPDPRDRRASPRRFPRRLHAARRRRPCLGQGEVAAGPPDDAPGDQGRVEAGRRRPVDEGQSAARWLWIVRGGA